jgi:DNA-binding transcriptional LysR family regulator
MGQSFRDWTARIELRQLRYLVAAADHGSFRKAAEILNVQQSTLSRSISQLEHATSTAIFDRSTSGIVASEMGAKVIKMARAVLEQIETISLSNYSSNTTGKLCIGFCTSLSTGSLRAAILDFRNRRPQCRVKTLERSRPRLATALHNGTLDVIISTGRLPSMKCKSQTLWSERILIAMPENHRLASRDVIYWTDLKGETVLMSRYDPYWEFENLVNSKLLGLEDRPTIEHHDVSRSILKSLISMKFGLGLMLESDIGVKVPSIVYRELQDGSGAARVGFSAFWEESNENPALTSFIDLLKERYPPLS